jgi:elongation factor 2
MMEKLWGDNYFDAAGKKWKKVDTADDGSRMKRAFVAFIMEPIQKLATEVMQGNKERYEKMMQRLEITLTAE